MQESDQNSLQDDSEKKLGILSKFKGFLFKLIINCGLLKGYTIVRNIGLLSADHGIIRNVIEFTYSVVKNVMVPRNDIFAVELKISKQDLLSKFTCGKYTRIPVYKDTIDEIVGFIHTKDLITTDSEDFEVRKNLYKAIYIPSSMKLVDLFIKMKTAKTHMAIVVDEYGCTEGLVTMTDIIEEIVGDMHDEHTVGVSRKVKKLKENIYEVEGKTLISHLERELLIELVEKNEDESYATISGLIFSISPRIPKSKEQIKHKNGILFTIEEADDRYIKKVILDVSNYKC